MRLFFFGPRILGVRPGISLGPEDFRRRGMPLETASGIDGSFIYVITGPPGMVKVGVTKNPRLRFATLQTGCPYPLKLVTLLATPGTGFVVEARIHEILDDHRATGEWFRCSPARSLFAVRQALDELEEPALSVSLERAEEILSIAHNAPAGSGRRPWYLGWTFPILAGVGTFWVVFDWLMKLPGPKH